MVIPELLTIPPGFSRGIIFDTDGRTVLSQDNHSGEKETIQDSCNVINLLDIIQEEQSLFGKYKTVSSFI